MCHKMFFRWSRFIWEEVCERKNMNFSKITLQFMFRRQQEHFSRSPTCRLWIGLHIPPTWIQLKMSGVFFQDQFMAVDVNMTLKKIWKKQFGAPGDTYLDENIIKTLIFSMENRCIDVISKIGGITSYWNIILFGFNKIFCQTTEICLKTVVIIFLCKKKMVICGIYA